MSGPAQSLQAGDGARFLRAWLADPLAIAAVAPSGRTLARIMTAGIGPETGPVIELGPGTGVFTRALLFRRVAPENLLLIERSPAFTLLLRERFPELDIVCDLAQSLDHHARARLQRSAGAIVSGLPLLAMSRSIQQKILTVAYSTLRPGGTFVQFTYHLIFRDDAILHVLLGRGLIHWQKLKRPDATAPQH
ncbi:class I SAM-dependent methyltransferase [Roseinatronobacter sp. S2]|uniref:class I SAM-dependent methyltransferase n=1 Tax=Roseinatronobacter sp. S2 TaxID=3035471 RepID=UPI00240ED699|nr:phospholipid methyltransferase [Roseinatronobacter sp. S2]WFE74745.1 phospholipid methyltransferase [Roseinatronobacter sp. S2]